MIEYLLIILAAVAWFVAFKYGKFVFVVLEPRQLFNTKFRVSAIVDKTTVQHFAAAYLMAFWSPAFAVGFPLGAEIRDLEVSYQGWDFLDILILLPAIWLQMRF